MRSHFSKRAQIVLASAQAEAKEQGFSVPTAWHILAAALREKGGSAFALLKRADVDLEKLQAGQEKPLISPDEASAETHQWSEILDAALGEAQRFGHEAAGTTHLLLGILRHGKSQAAALLRGCGLDLLQMRQLVLTCAGERGRGMANSSSHRPNLFTAACEWEGAGDCSELLIARRDLEHVVLASLGRSSDPHVVLVGPKGVGKRSLLRCVTRRIVREPSAAYESPLKALRLELHRLVGWRWQRAQQKAADFLRELRVPGPFLLVVDDVDVFADATHWDTGAFYLRHVLANCAFPVAVVCEPFTYERFLSRDPYTVQRMTTVSVPPPYGEEALRILRTVRDRLEDRHGLRITDEAVDQAFVSATEAREDEAFPLACRVLDQAAAQVCVEELTGSATTSTYLEEQLAELKRKKQEAVKIQDYQHAAQLRDEERRLRDEKLKLALNTEVDRERLVDASTVVKLLDPLVAGAARLTCWEDE